MCLSCTFVRQKGIIAFSLILATTHRSKGNLCIFILDLFRVLAFSYSWVEDINNYLIFYFIRFVDFCFMDIVINKAIQNYMKRIVVLYVEKLHSNSFLEINVSSIVLYLYQLEIFYQLYMNLFQCMGKIISYFPPFNNLWIHIIRFCFSVQ